MDNKGIYFTELTLKNVRCFGDEAVLKLSNDKGEWSRWNVILGDNGTGKTTLLQCLAGMELIPYERPHPINGLETKWRPKLHLRNHETFLKQNEKNFHIILAIDVQKRLPQYNLSYSGTGTHNASDFGVHDYIDIFILGYGADRRISFQILSEKEMEPDNSLTLFDDDAKLFNTEEWLLQIEFAASRDSELKEEAIKRRDLILESLKNILPDVTEIRFKDSTNIEKPVPRLQFKTPYGWVGLKELSYGYKTMVAWIVDVAARMFKKYPTSPNPLEEPVIILVDEIDLHLHPKWQRQIFEFLETRFPRAQFIVTAHSPLIVQSAPKDANIIVLKKEQVGDEFVVKIDNNKNSVWSWRIDQIMSSDLFGLEGVRNPLIEQEMEERTRLIQKQILSKEEQKRLDELNELALSLPTAESKRDIEAMEIVRKAAQLLMSQQKKNDQDK